MGREAGEVLMTEATEGTGWEPKFAPAPSDERAEESFTSALERKGFTLTSEEADAFARVARDRR